MRGVFPARIAELLRFEPVLVFFPVLRGGVIAIFAITTLQRNDFPHELIPFPILFRSTVTR